MAERLRRWRGPIIIAVAPDVVLLYSSSSTYFRVRGGPPYIGGSRFLKVVK